MRKGILITFIFLLISVGIFLLINKNTDNPSNIDTILNEKETEEQIDGDGPNGDDDIKDVAVTANNTFEFNFDKNTRIVALGDSLTEGIGDENGEGGYVGVIDKTINKETKLVSFKNYGHRGHRTDQLLTRLEDQDVIKSIAESDIVFITIGANDIMQVVKENFMELKIDQFTKERIQFEKRLNHILSKLNEINSHNNIYLLGIYNPFKKYFPEINELEQIVDEWSHTGNAVTNNYENTTFIPMKDIFDDSEEKLFADDNFHPNYLGYERMAERVLDYLLDKERRTP